MYLLIQCIFQLHTVYMIYIYVIYINLMAESEEELKSLLMKVKVESEKVGLELNIPVPSLHRKYMGKQCQTLFFWAPKSLQMVTAAMKLKDACSLKKKL